MCGIIGYTGADKNAISIVSKGLEHLEYRGYDSAGIAAIAQTHRKKTIYLKRAVGRIANLNDCLKNAPNSSCAIGHTRWATHGVPCAKNAHPHHDCKKNIFVVHNGIIENYKALKEVLEREGHSFTSETDTEIIAHLIERHSNKHIPLEDAVLDALFYIKGTFAIAVISPKEPDKIVVARRSSPLIIGIGENGNFFSSDISAITPHTKKVIYLDDDEMAVLSPTAFYFFDFKKKNKKKTVNEIDWNVEEAQKGGYEHFMLKEIHRQPESIGDSMRGRLIKNEGRAKLGGLEILNGKTKEIENIIITACGTAYYAGMLGKYMLERYAGIPTEVDLASEFRYRDPIFRKNTALLTISQSGETADTLAALNLAKKKKNLTLGIVNTVGSSIARLTDAGVYNHIGPEIGVASTKAFTSQAVVLTLFTLFLGRERGMSRAMATNIIKHLYLLPAQVKKILKQKKLLKNMAKKYSKYNNFLYLGRDYNYPIALEGALKMKEISYGHAEGYTAGEMKHGPIALINENFPTIIILNSPSSRIYEKTLSNLQEIKARSGPIFAVAEEGDNRAAELADDIFYVPKTIEMLNPILNVIPLQLLAYYTAILKNLDPDKPRNLAKSVTVE